MLSWRRREELALSTEALEDFPRAKRSPKPFFDLGGQGRGIISVDIFMNNVSFPTSLAAGRLRYLVHRIFRFWLYLLNCWASKYVPEIKPNVLSLLIDAEIIRKNEYYQTELSRLFTPYYYVCSSCGKCCLEVGCTPKYAVDFLLLGGSNEYIKLNQFNQLLKGFQNFLYHTLGFSTSTKEEIFIAGTTGGTSCAELRESGCPLPWGCRYVLCVIYLCYNFCRLMTWKEYIDYLKICLKYMIHVTISTHKVISSWKSLNKKSQITG